MCNKIEKSYLTILEDMTYAEYIFLIKSQSEKETDEHI